MTRDLITVQTYNINTQYYPGNIVIMGNPSLHSLFFCQKANTPGTYDSSCWTSLASLSDYVSLILIDLCPLYVENIGYKAGDIRRWNGNIYKCKENIAIPAGPFDSSKWELTTTSSRFTDIDFAIDKKVSKAGDTMTGILTIPSVGGMWVQGRDANKNAINVAGQANNNQSYDGILWNKCYNGNFINIGRIGNELDVGYIEASQTDNSLRKFVKFAPAEDKLKFGDSGVDKGYIKLSDGGFYGNWNGITDDHNTDNTSDTWVPVYTGSKIQHRVIPTDYNNKIIGEDNHAASTGAALSSDTGRIGLHWYTTTGKIANQPAQWGFLLTCATAKGATEQHSIFMEQANGSLYHMGTNASSSGSPPAYKKIYDSGNLVPTDLSYTRVNGNVSNDAKCRRYGNIVEFTGQFGVSSSSLARDTILWNGFPKPKTVVYFTARCEGNWTTYSFYISTNGEIKNQQANIPSGTYNCNLVYICQ